MEVTGTWFSGAKVKEIMATLQRDRWSRDSGKEHGRMLNTVLELVRQASTAIMAVYDTAFQVEIKEDGSPLTRADRASHLILDPGLRAQFQELPVISEETSEVIPYSRRSPWERFWLVDPLDGTKEFVKRNGEFTVNVALIEKGYPVLGVIGVPVTGSMYYARKGEGAWKIAAPGATAERLSVRTLADGSPVTVVKSRSHPSPELARFLSNYHVGEEVSAGSALKFCLVAEGRADLYPRLGPTMEWDTAAGQAIVEEAGGQVLDLEGRRFRYNKESLRNGPFYVKAGF